MYSYCKLENHSKEVSCCTFSKLYFVTSSGDKTLRVYSTNNFKELSYSPIKEFKYGVNFVTFNTEENLLSTACSDGKAHLLQLSDKDYKILAIFRHSDSNIVQICSFTNDSNYLLTGSADGSIALWDINKKKLIKEISGHPEGNVYAITPTPCDFYLITGSGLGDIRVWDMRNNSMKPLFQIEAHDEGVSSCGVSCITFSKTFHQNNQDEPNNQCYLMASCGQDNKIKLWIFSTKSSKILQSFHELSGHNAPISCCCFSNNGKQLASSSFDKSVIIWDPILGEQIMVLDGHTAIVTSVCYNSDDRLLASTSYDKTAIIWDFENKNDIQTLMSAQNNKVHQKSEDLLSFEETPNKQTQLEVHPRIPFQDWSCDQVASWLIDEVKLGQYEESFRLNEIDGAELTSLSSDILQKDLGIAPLGHRNKIIRAITSMKEAKRSPGASKGSPEVNLSSLVAALPPNLQQLAPTFIHNVINQQVGGTNQSDGSLQWKNVSTSQDVSIRDVRKQRDSVEQKIPDEYLCPISRQIMRDPVIAADGFTYERNEIENWISRGKNLSPMTNVNLPNKKLVMNHTLKSLISTFVQKQKSIHPDWVQFDLD